MRILVAVLFATFAFSAGAVEKPRLVILDLTSAGGVDPTLARSLTEALGVEAQRTGFFNVTTQGEVATLLGLERQKQLSGCADDSSSCTTELAGALGAKFMMTGSVARFGADAVQLSLQMQDTEKSRTVGRATRIAKDLPGLLAVMPWAFSEAATTPPPPEPSRAAPITLMVGGGVGAIAGGVLLLQASLREATVAAELRLSEEQPDVILQGADYYRNEAAVVTGMRFGGAIGVGVGAALVAVGAVLLPKTEGTRVAIVPTGTGAAIAGSF
ncbi:MAG: hypothetical protein ACO1OB_20390 [Archangium sp.]